MIIIIIIIIIITIIIIIIIIIPSVNFTVMFADGVSLDT